MQSFFRQGGICVNEAQRVIEYFSGDLFVKELGLEIAELSKQKAVVTVTVQSNHQNANGFAQGGMLYTVADFTFALLANFLHSATVTQGGQVQYLRPAKVGEALTFTATETAYAGHNTICQVVAKNSGGETVCVCSFNGFIKDVK